MHVFYLVLLYDFELFTLSLNFYIFYVFDYYFIENYFPFDIVLLNTFFDSYCLDGRKFFL